MDYSIIDLSKWDRGELFNFYIKKLPIVMNLTVDIDVTNLKEFASKNSLSFYATTLWVVSKIINTYEEFKFGWNEKGELIKWDKVSPSYTDFNKETQRFIKLLTEYEDDVFNFCNQVKLDMINNKNSSSFMENRPSNCFDVSCLPWIKYKSFDAHVFDDGKYLAPVVTWGKYENENGKLIMPLTLNIHHAVCDGFHLSRFFIEVQNLINNL